MKKEVINYYRSFYDVSRNLTSDQFYEFNMAIFEVLFFEKHIDSVCFQDQGLSLLWISVKHSIKKSIEGFCSKKNIVYEKALHPLAKGVQKASGDVKVKKPAFIKPTIEEIKMFCKESGCKINVEIFFNHYETNGWMVGKNKMKSWKHAVKNWSLRNKPQDVDDIPRRWL